MEIEATAQFAAFAVFAFIAVAGALGMTTTMSMFRSAIFLMASFIGVGGLFVLMMADLLGLLQVMMYIGGMLVMALFMVLFSNDPGGAMMASMMDLPLVEKFFSLGLKRGEMAHGHGGMEQEHGAMNHDHGSMDHGHGETDQDHGGIDHGHSGKAQGHEGTQHDDPAHKTSKEQHSTSNEDHETSNEQRSTSNSGSSSEHDMEPMFIVEHKKPAAAMAVAVWLALSGLMLFRPAWPVVDQLPPQNSAEQVGDLLMGKYMIAFEGAGLMILLGIFGAVYLSRPGRFPDPTGRGEIQAAVADVPAPIEEDPLEPLRPDHPHA